MSLWSQLLMYSCIDPVRCRMCEPIKMFILLLLLCNKSMAYPKFFHEVLLLTTDVVITALILSR
jgi:hypothetical protein